VPAEHPLGQVAHQRLDLGQLRHTLSVPSGKPQATGRRRTADRPPDAGPLMKTHLLAAAPQPTVSAATAVPVAIPGSAPVAGVPSSSVTPYAGPLSVPVADPDDRRRAGALGRRRPGRRVLRQAVERQHR
jgi:hypothetical protein